MHNDNDIHYSVVVAMAIYFRFLLAAMSEELIGIWLLDILMHGAKVIPMYVWYTC